MENFHFSIRLDFVLLIAMKILALVLCSFLCCVSCFSIVGTDMVRMKVSRKRSAGAPRRYVRPRIEANVDVDSDSERGNVAEDSTPTQVTPVARSNPDNSIESMLLQMPPEQIAALMKAAEARLSTVAPAAASASAATSPNVELFPAESTDNDAGVDPTDVDTLLEAREDMLGVNAELLGQYGGGMDSRILRQVKLTPEYVKKQTRIVNMVRIIGRCEPRSGELTSRASGEFARLAEHQS